MRTQLAPDRSAVLCLVLTLSILTAPALASPDSAQTASKPAAPAGTAEAAAAFSPALAGTWRSDTEPVRLVTDFDRSVWGEGAASERATDLVVEPSGSATLTVTRRVVDAKGRTIPASTSIEEVRLVIGGARPGPATRMEHDVTIVSAERRYPDDPPSAWALEGVGVKVVTFTDAEGKTLEVRFDTPEGRGSFWELLHRADKARSSRASR